VTSRACGVGAGEYIFVASRLSPRTYNRAVRGPRLLLLVCLGVGLGAVAYAAQAHLREVARGLRADAERDVRADLRVRGRALVPGLEARLRDLAPAAVYALDRTMVRPAPPAEAASFSLPPGTLTERYLQLGDF
jgi:hypothetical protein